MDSACGMLMMLGLCVSGLAITDQEPCGSGSAETSCASALDKPKSSGLLQQSHLLISEEKEDHARREEEGPKADHAHSGDGLPIDVLFSQKQEGRQAPRDENGLNADHSHGGEQQSVVLNGDKQNVLGTALQNCSTTGTALTGFTRSGKCADEKDDDAGSHHICIKMKSDFCTVTNQENWCDDKMTCMGTAGTCAIDHWCVCQWAFAHYLATAGGCDNIVDLVCDATNMAAFRAYEKSTDASHKAALQCIKTKCNIQ